MEDELDVDSILSRLSSEVRGGHPGRAVVLTEAEVQGLCLESRKIFLTQPMLLDLDVPLKICGDINGQHTDLLRLFQFGGFPSKVNYLFLGNSVDRGMQSLETICLLLALKIRYPERFFLLRGTQECGSVNHNYAFYDECKRRLSIKVWKYFTECFNCLPLAAIIDDKIFCSHGGLSPHLVSMKQIKHIIRPTDIPDRGLMCDLMWSCPDKNVQGWRENDHGVSLNFGPDVIAKFLNEHDFELICRAHQAVKDGYEFFDLKRQLVTLFSAPNHYGELENAGAILSVDGNLKCSLQILKPFQKKVKYHYGGANFGRPVMPLQGPLKKK